MLIEVDTHCHSVASTHAYSTVKELAISAKENGLRGFALTDHTPASPDSPHIWHFHNLKCLPKEINGVRLLLGAEANIIDLEGNIDLDNYELRNLQWVIASFHTPVVNCGSSDDYTRAYINLAKKYELVDVIGHCETENFPFDYELVLKHFKEYGKLVEINESSIMNRKGSKKNAYTILEMCKKYEIQIVVNSDCHYCGLIGKVPISEEMINSLDFPRELILNSDYDRLMEYINKKRG